MAIPIEAVTHSAGIHQKVECTTSRTRRKDTNDVSVASDDRS